ncbi:related to Glutaredoxin [Sporisorium reilianum f. sp. reilianum]|uniref:Related to Glutaredoxin n=1 Tax=Sporisorium reilianum f. sp. reilianum TaxID=72559 RepID=A0A2N8ULU0_9BASI|nr:related to Glutaredoxin [Sporisorium reilianum f. sp. reilianum]
MTAAAESKENLLHDLESGVASPPPTRSFCLPPLALLRRKKLWVVLLLLPAVYVVLLYNGTATSASPTINELVGKLPGAMHHYDDAHVDSDGHLHNALLDTLHIEGTAELTALKTKLGHEAAASTSEDVAVKLDARDESVLLLLLALQRKDYAVGDDWQDVFVERKPLGGGVFAQLNSEPDNKFTQLLAHVGLPATATPAEFAILNNAHQLYMLSRQQWARTVRATLGLTVFSKSYCPYSKKAKALLNSLNATYTTYEVDLRPDAHELQPLLAKLTAHATFPTVLARERLVGGSDDLADLQSIGALKSVLQSVGAL